MSRLLSLAAFAAVLAACSGPVEDTRPGQPVKHRQDAFKAILRVFEPMGLMLRSNRYDADEFARLAHELLAVRDGPWTYFEADTLYPPSKAKASVWERRTTFEAEQQRFYAAVDQLVAEVKPGNKAALGAAYEELHASCKSCHKSFKK